MSANEAIHIVDGGVGRLREVERLYVSLHEHRCAIDPVPGIPTRPAAAAWARRRRHYEAWLAEPGALLLLAEDAGVPVGYAVVREREGSESWATAETCAELESLAVLPSHRGRGIGGALLDAVHERLRAAGIRELYVEVLATNEAAERLYARSGLTRWTVTMLGRIPEA